MSTATEPTRPTPQPAAPTELQTDRRAMLIAAGAAAAGLAAYPFLRRWVHDAASVFVARNQRYDGPLVRTIRDGLLATGFDPAGIRGGNVLLKPNLVEPVRSCPQMTTHPAVVVAAAEVFRGWGAEVTVGEGPGHVRDTELALVESGLAGRAVRRAAAVCRLELQPTRLFAERRPGHVARGLSLSAAGDRGRPDRVACRR